MATPGGKPNACIEQLSCTLDTNGIALLIASTQIKDFFGLTVAHVPGDLFGRLAALLAHAGTISWPALTISATSLAIIVLWPRLTKRIPGSIVALAFATVAVALLHLDVATIGSAFGGIPQGLPPFAIPSVRPDLIGALLPSAFTVAFLAAVESLLSAVVADSMSGDHHKSNVELVAQGIANIASPFFGGIPATGAIARTATNIRSGGTTPIAGIIHAAVLLIILLVAAPLARFVPLAALAAVLMVVAYHMGAWYEIARIVRLSKADVAVWLTTFGLTAFADLTVAVGVGMALAALLYIHRITQTTTVDTVTTAVLEDGRAHVLHDRIIPPYVSIVRIRGPFLFGTTEKLDATVADVERLEHIVIVRLRDMPALDATGVYALETFTDRVRRSGRELLLCGAMDQPLRLLRGSTFLRHLGAENLLPNIESAIHRAEYLGAPAAV
jgi:sulfate permease, SulP family